MGTTDLPRLLAPARLRRFGVAVALAMVAAFVVFNVTVDGVQAAAGGRLGGDWAAFRTAGVLLLDDPGSLLDVGAQRSEMAAYLDGEFAPFPYPPLFGFAYVPFALLSFQAGYIAYVVVLAALAIVAVRWTMDLLDVSPEWRPVGMLGALTYTGTFLSIGGAQNATITLFLLAATMRLVDRGDQVAAGLVLTLLWFKPQFVIPVLGLLLVARHVRTVATTVIGGLGIVVATGLVFGWDWPSRWYDILALTDAGNRVFNTVNTVSPVEWLRGVLVAPWGDVLGLGLAVVIGAGFAVMANRYRRAADLLPLVGLALVLTAPHALRYELALLVPALGVIVHRFGAAAGVVAWGVAPLLVVGIPAPLRILYVVAVAGAWLSGLTPQPEAPHTAATQVEAGKPRPSRSQTTTNTIVDGGHADFRLTRGHTP